MGILKTVELADFAEKNAKRIRILKTVGLADFAEKNAKRIDPFTVDRTGDSNGVFQTIRREILDFRIFWLSSHIARFLCVNLLEPDENLTGPT